jgi:hypothetical protein
MAMTSKSFITGFSGDIEVAGTLAIDAPRALYAVAFGSKRKKSPPELLPPAAADRACGIRLKQIKDWKIGNIINRSHGSTYLDEKSVLTSGALSFLVSSRRSSESIAQGISNPSFLGLIRVRLYSAIYKLDRIVTASPPISVGAPRSRDRI